MAHAFFSLNPEKVLQAIESCGFSTTGEFYQLNSYENRVFDLILEKDKLFDKTLDRLIAKFYRPNRWSKEAILEEHDFLQELAREGVRVVPPMSLKNNGTLVEFEGMYLAVFPRIKGRMPQEFLAGQLKTVGAMIARLHNVGSHKKTRHRPIMNTSYYGGWPTLQVLKNWISPEVRDRYIAAAENILNFLDDRLDEDQFIRVHGDLHKGNLLEDSHGFFLVDFDDFGFGPPVQDFWMLLSQSEHHNNEELNQLIDGYSDLRDFDEISIDLIPGLRGLRIISYAGWIAARWEDPSFPRIFPEFGTYKYWAEEVESLEKIAWSL